MKFDMTVTGSNCLLKHFTNHLTMVRQFQLEKHLNNSLDKGIFNESRNKISKNI